MIDCVVYAFVWAIVIIIVLLLIEWLAQLVFGIAIPPRIRTLAGVAVFLLVVLRLLECAGLFSGRLRFP